MGKRPTSKKPTPQKNPITKKDLAEKMTKNTKSVKEKFHIEESDLVSPPQKDSAMESNETLSMAAKKVGEEGHEPAQSANLRTKSVQEKNVMEAKEMEEEDCELASAQNENGENPNFYCLGSAMEEECSPNLTISKLVPNDLGLSNDFSNDLDACSCTQNALEVQIVEEDAIIQRIIDSGEEPVVQGPGVCQACAGVCQACASVCQERASVCQERASVCQTLAASQKTCQTRPTCPGDLDPRARMGQGMIVAAGACHERAGACQKHAGACHSQPSRDPASPVRTTRPDVSSTRASTDQVMPVAVGACQSVPGRAGACHKRARACHELAGACHNQPASVPTSPLWITCPATSSPRASSSCLPALPTARSNGMPTASMVGQRANGVPNDQISVPAALGLKHKESLGMPNGKDPRHVPQGSNNGVGSDPRPNKNGPRSEFLEMPKGQDPRHVL